VAYLLDANVFIAAKNLHYGFDFCPAFWDWLVDAHERRVVFSVEEVGNEIRGSDDGLAVWANGLNESFFLPLDPGGLTALGTVSNWASSQTYDASAISTFLQCGDYYLVAQALHGGHVVVTHEKAENTRRKIKIPNACLALGVNCITPFKMLQKERARFVLGGG
jgi:hypothetical protein